MFTITAGEKNYELKTTLGISIKLEDKFKMPLTKIFEKLEEAEIKELENILAIAAGMQNNQEFKENLRENWDYTDMQFAVQGLLVRLMFSGDDEKVEQKLEKFPADEEQKNVFREILGLPIKEAFSTANSL